MKNRILFLGIFCAVLFGLGFAARTALNQTENRPAYTIVWQETTYEPSGAAIPESVETKYVSANGNAYSLRRYADGKTEEMFWIVGKGVFLKRGTKLHFLSDWHAQPLRTAEMMKNNNRYVRSENVLGLPTVVISAQKDVEGHDEFFFAPALNSEIKMVMHGPKTIVKEPVSLVFGEPDPKLFKFPEELKIDYSHYEQLHGPQKNN